MLTGTHETSKMLQRAQALKSKLIEFRRHLHSHPELSFRERETSKFLISILSGLNCRLRSGVAENGITAEFGEGRTVVVRADMDALPICEQNKVEYASLNEGVMHACGHDAHMTCALGAAMLLSENPPEKGCVRVLFQPAEEAVNDEGKGGATLMMEHGAIDGAEAAFALHVWPELPVGTIGVREGSLLAGCDSFTITLRGLGAHGAFPETGIDTVVLAAQVIMALQQVISRRKSALEPAILTVGGVKSSSFAPNVIPGEVVLVGTIRYLSKSTQDLLHREIENACRIAETFGGSYSLDFTCDAPALVNDPRLTGLVRESCAELLGAAAVIDVPQAMGAEDFAFMANKLPGTFFLLGTGIPGSQRTLHSPTFDINEDALPIGAAMLADCALRYLRT